MFSYLFLIALIATQSRCTPIPSSTEQSLQKNETVRESIASIAQQQTETIKKIVADQQQTVQDPRETQISEMTLEELKIRCQHLAKLLNITENNSFSHNKNDRIDQIAYSSKLSNHKPYTESNVQKRPVYLQPNVITRVPSQKTNGFYITTQQPTSTTKKPTPTVPLQHSIKYIRLEPVILQKTILNDGRTIYYWHRSLPTAVQVPKNSNDEKKQIEDVNQFETTTTRAPSTTASSYYDFRSFFPFYSSGQEIAPTTSTTTTAAPLPTPSTTQQPKEELMYGHQLRFVVPVPYDMGDKATLKHPMAFDQFAYYPKVLQPSTVNVQMPYTPTFQMIKTLALPNEYNTNNDAVRNE